MSDTPGIRLIGPLEMGRYELATGLQDPQIVSLLTEAGYSTIESAIGYMLEPSFVHEPYEHASVIGRILNFAVIPVLPIEDLPPEVAFE